MHLNVWFCMYPRTPYTPARTGVLRVSKSLIHSTVWYRMYLLTPYTPARTGVCRVAESLMHLTARYLMWILTPYAPVRTVATSDALTMDNNLHSVEAALRAVGIQNVASAEAAGECLKSQFFVNVAQLFLMGTVALYRVCSTGLR